jgi:hypothetical protein
MRPSSQDYLSRWIPAILVIAFLCDVVFHFVRLDFLAFRGDEAVRQAVPLGYALEPDRRFQNDRTSGDLAGIANLPEYRVFRPQVFTTDHFGYRNSPSDSRLPPSVLLLGSSFTYGTANSDEQTLARQLEISSGCSVYNAGGWDRVVANARALVGRLGMRQSLVLMEVLERDPWERPIAIETRKPRFRYSAVAWWYYDQAMRSRLKSVAERLYKSLSNDRIFPNTFKANVVVRELEDGRPMLFHRNLEHRGRLPETGPHVRAIERLRDALREDGHRLGIYLIPDKLTVYRDLVSPLVPHADMGARVLAELERRLRALRIPVVNLEPVLHAASREELSSGELIYWPDDTHWNPTGIKISAREIARAFDLPASCGPAPAKH